MASYTYSALNFTENDKGSVTSFRNSKVQVIAPGTSFEFTSIGGDMISLIVPANIRVDGALIDREILGYSYSYGTNSKDRGLALSHIKWGKKSATVLVIEELQQTSVVLLDGDALPTFKTNAALQKWLNKEISQLERDWGLFEDFDHPLDDYQSMWMETQTLPWGSFAAIRGYSQDSVYVEQRSSMSWQGVVTYTTRWGAGNDSVTGGESQDVIYGGAGNDTLTGLDDDDTLLGEDGNDLIYGGKGSDSLVGDAGNDTIYGDAQYDRIYGGDGNDVLYGGGHYDNLFGGDGNDKVYGDTGNDWLHGDAGNDALYGGKGADNLFGGAGNDTLDGGAGRDALYGGAGADTFVFNTGMGHDTVLDFSKAEGDILRIKASLANMGVKGSVATLVNKFGVDLDDAVRLDFGARGSITVLGVDSPEDLIGSIVLF